ncbi:MAG: Glu-tRNA(Gln) amidotransferase subunit GatD [Candidatus Thorarchaeota archaeon]
MSLNGSGYGGLVLKKLSASDVEVGDTIKIIDDGNEYTGILMPRAQIGADPDHVVLKMPNGYNVGIRLSTSSKISRVRKARGRRRGAGQEVPAMNPKLPSVSILSTGGTIASKVDYMTGAVNPALTAQDLYDTVPELRDHANVRAKVLMSVFSEDITPSDWSKIARGVAAEVKKRADGVVIAHGTDTLGFTSAALSFALQDLPVPVALVGSQRSSDRPSSDSATNLVWATDLVVRANAAEVMVVMHAHTDDSYAYAHRGTRVRKSHTSRRDAFQSINSYPLFKVDSSDITEMTTPLFRRDPNRKLRLKPKFDDRVAIVKTHPGFSAGMIDSLVDREYRGIVIEGTGLGHAPKIIQPSLKKALDTGIVIAMTSQCISGRIDMNVYRTGVELLEMGVIPCEDMLTETAYVKLAWLLANMKTPDKVRESMSQSLVGEIEMRTEMAEYEPHREIE